MRKKLYLLLPIAAVIILTFAGCSGPRSGSSAVSGTPSVDINSEASRIPPSGQSPVSR